MRALSGVVVVAFGVFLTGLAALIAVKPRLAERFLRSFASSARAHYVEQSLRLLAGGALAVFATSMWYPRLFMFLGWMMAITAAVLLILPWRWHHEFARRAMPRVIAHLRLFALGAFALGVLVFYGVSRAVLH
jgi:hypothetical protein